MSRSLALIIISLNLALAGCGLFSKVADPKKAWGAQEFYEAAKDELSAGNYDAAIRGYEALESRYPYGRFAQQAQLDTAYAHYRQSNVTEAIAAAERFIKLHPNHAAVDYAYYIKGLALYQGDLGIFGTLAGGDLSDRDPKASRESFDAFKDLVTRFPESRYADDSRARMEYLVNSLASHEVHVARYYLRRGAPLAAANRAQYAITTYPGAPITEEALAIMVQSYDQLGLAQLRDDSKRLLRQNFPSSRFLASGELEGSKRWWKWW